MATSPKPSPLPPAASSWMRIGELSRRTGVSPDLLRVWERRYGLLHPRRTAGNVRLYSRLDEARVRLMTRHLATGRAAAQAAELASTASLVNSGSRGAIPSDVAVRASRALSRALEAFDESAAEQVLQHLLSDFSSAAVIRDVLLPYLRDIGERWAAGALTVAHEHFASNFAHFRLLALARGWDRGFGARALLACAPDDQHTLGLIGFGIALHRVGWRITYLGAQTPTDTLVSAAEQISPELIVVSGAINDCLTDRADELRSLAGGYSLAIAGRAASRALASACGARYLDGGPIGAAHALASRGDGRYSPLLSARR